MDDQGILKHVHLTLHRHPMLNKVVIDGKQTQNVYKIVVTADARNRPMVELTFSPTVIEIEGEAPVAATGDPVMLETKEGEHAQT